MAIHLSRCQSAACNIMKELDTISGIDCFNQSAEVSIATIEAKRTIINAELDEMIRVIKEKANAPKPPED